MGQDCVQSAMADRRSGVVQDDALALIARMGSGCVVAGVGRLLRSDGQCSGTCLDCSAVERAPLSVIVSSSTQPPLTPSLANRVCGPCPCGHTCLIDLGCRCGVVRSVGGAPAVVAR